MNYLKLLILSSLLFFISSQVPAIGTVEPPIKKGAEIQIKSYDAVTKAIEVGIVGESAVGPNYTDPLVLANALGFNGKKSKELVSNPLRLKGVVLNLRSDLKILNFYELTERLPPHLQAKVKKKIGTAKFPSSSKKKKTKNN